MRAHVWHNRRAILCWIILRVILTRQTLIRCSSTMVIEGGGVGIKSRWSNLPEKSKSQIGRTAYRFEGLEFTDRVDADRLRRRLFARFTVLWVRCFGRK